MFVTLLRPTEGVIRVNGVDVLEQPRKVRQSIGYMAQETSIDPELTARENVRFAAEAYGVRRGKIGARIDELLDLVDLADVADKRADNFSGGMKKRLDAATALVHRPPLVFLDEPTTGLDPNARNRLWEYFERINEQGTTIFLTTQYLEEADQLCDRLSVINNGEIVTTGTPAALKREVGGKFSRSRSTTERKPEGVLPRSRVKATSSRKRRWNRPRMASTSPHHALGQVGPDLLVALCDAGIPVTGFNVHAPTVDDVFLAITGEPVIEEAAETASAEGVR